MNGGIIGGVPHLSELHGATTHLAVVAIPLYAIVLAVVLVLAAEVRLLAVRRGHATHGGMLLAAGAT